MGRAGPLAIDHFMKVIGLGDIGRLHEILPGGLPIFLRPLFLASIG
jgi:hypothetical protein